MAVEHLTASGSREAERGLTLLEALISLAILFMIVIGLLPLFSRSIVSNAQGSNSTVAANFARSQLERLQQVDFNDAALEIPAGNDSLVIPEHYDSATRAWLPGPPPAGDPRVLWRRTTTVRQYGAADLLEDGSLDNPLAGGADRSLVQLKEIEVRVLSEWQGTTLGPLVDLRLVAVRGI